MIIRVDTREQCPLPLNFDGVQLVRDTIPVFDYALEGDQDRFAIERKSLSDFVQAVVLQDSYRRELEKIRKAQAAGMTRIYYVVEAYYLGVRTYNYNRFSSGRVHPGLIYKRWRELAYHHGVHVVWADNAEGAAWAVYLLLKSRVEELQLLDGTKTQGE